jgi:peroxiredoxin (alkyl hydroperoxide reductase subunit C)
VKVGDKIPDVTVDAFFQGEITKIGFSDFAGKWLVLAFYPADFTFVCPTELEELADNYETFKSLTAEVLSISTDTTYVHKAWHDTSPAISKIEYPMLADPAGIVCRAFGTYIEDEGLSLRATFIVDPDGVVKAIDTHDNSIGRSCREILRKLQAAKFVYEHSGQVCPASWEPEQKTLKPNLELVGKI